MSSRMTYGWRNGWVVLGDGCAERFTRHTRGENKVLCTRGPFGERYRGTLGKADGLDGGHAKLCTWRTLFVLGRDTTSPPGPPAIQRVYALNDYRYIVQLQGGAGRPACVAFTGNDRSPCGL